jgi:hypothetical protein
MVLEIKNYQSINITIKHSESVFRNLSLLLKINFLILSITSILHFLPTFR